MTREMIEFRIAKKPEKITSLIVNVVFRTMNN